ncbi:hypothetical protein OIU85_029306 [Salix viminalis]|uniref:Uncharacterized protein n=1 Tax=Salix viminalis TaxID=40686 RepID=A0A9Q0T7G0_SALVM|nr:hypothetical protein OIU85_029306 [Salix viminalis]
MSPSRSSIIGEKRNRKLSRDQTSMHSMNPRGLAPCSYPEVATRNTARGESRILGRSREQKGKKRKYDAGKHSKGFKKRKEGVKQALKSLGKQVQYLDNIIVNQENLTDKLLHPMTPGPEAFDQVLREESAILFPDSDDLDVLKLETKKLSDIISPLKHRSKMLDERVQLLCEMMLLE